MTVEPEAERDQHETLRKLEEVTGVVLRHVGKATLLDELLLQLRRVVDADTCAVLLLDEERRFLTVRAATGFDPGADDVMPIPFGKGMAGRVAASGKPVVIDDLSEVELASPQLRARGIVSVVAIPIATGNRVIGVAHAGSTRPRHFDEEDVWLLGLMADRIALAVTHSRLYEAERRARRDAEEAYGRLSFLAEASTILASSLDYESTLQAVARLVVPHLADWCAVDVTDREQGLVRIAVAHVSLADDELLQRAGQLRRPEHDDSVGPFAVLRRGSAELAPHVSDDLLGALAGNEEAAETLRELGFASYMCVPMHGRDHVLGRSCLPRALPAAMRRETSPWPRRSRAGRRRPSRTRCCTGRSRSAPRGPACSRRSETASSSSTGVGSFASGTPLPRPSPACRKPTSSAAPPRRRSPAGRRWQRVCR
jgi:GAF domain-containing protein